MSIDCGSSDSYTDSRGIKWVGEDAYVHSGEQRLVSSGYTGVLNSLRVFPARKKNCYTIPVPTGEKILVRATFNYDNYDGLNSPPAFNMYFDGNYCHLLTLQIL